MEPVRELHVDDTDLTQLAIGNHLTRLKDQLMPGIAVGNTDNFMLPLAQFHQCLRLLRGETQGFFAHHVQAGFQRCLANSEMGIVWRSDGNRLYAVRPGGFFTE
ncbi:hypothetical protein D3C76_1597060 [compost metagenome]